MPSEQNRDRPSLPPDPEPVAPPKTGTTMTRQEFVRTLGLATAGVSGAVALVAISRRDRAPRDPVGPDTVRTLPEPADLPGPGAEEDVLLRMQRELRQAMAKPVEERKWVMVIDQRKCVGCHACTIGCIAENKLPPGVVYRPVTTEETGVFPNVRLQFLPRPCMQCEEPPCVPVCPVDATWRRPDGITIIDYDRCIGCRYCLTACPYGARTSDFGEYYTDGTVAGDGDVLAADGAKAWEHQPNHELGKRWNRTGHQSPMGNARKCHFCLHRLEVGELPMCATTCIGRATYFGDANDPRSLVSELLQQHQTRTLLPHLGTKPRVFYIA
ncbi:MAG: 4Fe-4S dicluster domain-containing protein [Gemmatimonadales bacterium]